MNIDIRKFPNLCAKDCFLIIPYMTKEEIDLWNANNETIGETGIAFIFDIDNEGLSFDIEGIIERDDDYAIRVKLPIFTNPQEEYRINVGCITKLIEDYLFKFQRKDKTHYFDKYFGQIFEEYTDDDCIKYIDAINIYINEKIKINKLILMNNPYQSNEPTFKTFPNLLENINNELGNFIHFPYCYPFVIKNWNNKPFICELGKFVVFLKIEDDCMNTGIKIRQRTTTREDIPDWVETEITICLPVVNSDNIEFNDSMEDGYWEFCCGNIPLFVEMDMETLLNNHLENL